jgi:hypothetical protein
MRPFNTSATDTCDCDFVPIVRMTLECSQCEIERVEKEDREFEATRRKNFQNKWKNSTLFERLEMHSKPKLLILARRKKLKVTTRTLKGDLLEMLKDTLVHNDFPIK